MIDNVILVLTGVNHNRDTAELLEKCHPLGMFDAIGALSTATSVADLYRTVLVDTPLGEPPRSQPARPPSRPPTPPPLPPVLLLVPARTTVTSRNTHVTRRFRKRWEGLCGGSGSSREEDKAHESSLSRTHAGQEALHCRQWAVVLVCLLRCFR